MRFRRYLARFTLVLLTNVLISYILKLLFFGYLPENAVTGILIKGNPMLTSPDIMNFGSLAVILVCNIFSAIIISISIDTILPILLAPAISVPYILWNLKLIGLEEVAGFNLKLWLPIANAGVALAFLIVKYILYLLFFCLFNTKKNRKKKSKKNVTVEEEVSDNTDKEVEEDTEEEPKEEIAEKVIWADNNYSAGTFK